MKTSFKGIALIKQFEGCRLKAYKDPVGIWTIGYGATYYEDGTKVKGGDVITQERADFLLCYHVHAFAEKVDQIVPLVSQEQFDALVSFAYNVGIGALGKSTLLKKLKVNTEDPSIRNEFAKWNKAGGKVLAGLIKRRKAEADLYFSG